MTKRFCDICEKEAGHPAIEWSENYDKFGLNYVVDGQDVSHPKIVAKVHFSFRDHPTGFGGPPDLCQDCALRLIREIVNVFER